MDERKKDILAAGIVFIFLLAVIINNYIWLKIDYSPFTYDAHRQFMFSLRVFKEYQNLSLRTFSDIIKMTQRHPPLTAMVTAPLYFLFGIAQDTGTMANSAIFITILLFSVYGIAKKLKGRKAGILSVFICGFYPIIFNHMKTYTLDLPVTAMASLGILFLLLSENLTRTAYSLLFGLSCGLGFLTKDNFPFYVIAPFITSVVQGIKVGGAKDRNETWAKNALSWLRRSAVSLFIFSFTAVLISMYYLSKKHNLVFGKLSFGEYFTFYSPPGDLPDVPLYLLALFKRIKSLLWYVWGFINWQVSFFFFIIFIISVIYFIRLKFKGKAILLSSLFGFILIAFTKGAYADHMTWMGVRFTMPVLPYVAIISAIGILSIKTSIFRRVAVFLIIVAGTIQSAVISYGSPLLPEEVVIPFQKKMQYSVSRYCLFPEEIILFKQLWPAYGGPLSRPNIELPGKIRIPEEIFETIDSLNHEHHPINILVIPDVSRIWACLEYNSFVKNRPYQILGDWKYFLEGHNQFSRTMAPNERANTEQIVLESDYIIDKEAGELGENYLLNYVRALDSVFKRHRDKFSLIKEFVWPDNSEVSIYRKD